MSLSKEIAHELRTVNTQPADAAVMPSWAKIIPVAFYAGFTFFVLGLAYNTFNENLQEAKRTELSRVVDQYNEMMRIDAQTTKRLINQRNAAVRVARWVEYSPMVQPIVAGIFFGLDERAQINTLNIERREGVTPEYAMSLAFAAEQGFVDPLVAGIREKVSERGWQVITQNQIHQDGIANIQAYIQPTPSLARYESLYFPILTQPGATTSPTTGAAQ